MAACVISPVPYFPSEQQAQSFWTNIPRGSAAVTRPPPGFPQRLVSPLAWTAEDIKGKLPSLQVNLDCDEVIALESALAAFKAVTSNLSDISVDTFPLPNTLAQRLKSVGNECYNGVGFAIVRGLEPLKYTAFDNVALYAGISAHIAPQRGFVDRKRESVISHLLHVETAVTPAFTPEQVAFHSDNSEIMGLYVLEGAKVGGKLALSSSFALYNKLVETQPEILETLAAPWVLDTFKDYSQHPPLCVPFLHPSGSDKVVFRFSRYPMTGFRGMERNPALPPLTEAQIRAMDAVQFMATANSVEIPMARGNMLFINDQAIMHARGSFSNGAGSAKRHLLKMFLRDPAQSWPVSDAAFDQRHRIYGPNREDGTRVETWWTTFEQGQEGEAPTNG